MFVTNCGLGGWHRGPTAHGIGEGEQMINEDISFHNLVREYD